MQRLKVMGSEAYDKPIFQLEQTKVLTMASLESGDTNSKTALFRNCSPCADSDLVIVVLP